ncbi:MAG: hypothetical protein PHU07_03620 [Acidocella sp.]|nr:hypothetical protein [Acidocella sp.]
MLDLCAQAEAASITAVIGAGVSPGLINVNIRDASTKLGDADQGQETAHGPSEMGMALLGLMPDPTGANIYRRLFRSSLPL